MGRVAEEEKAAAKATAADYSRSHDVRLELWEHTPHTRTQQVQSGLTGGGSQTIRFRGTAAYRTTAEALKGAKGKNKEKGTGNGNEQQKGKSRAQEMHLIIDDPDELLGDQVLLCFHTSALWVTTCISFLFISATALNDCLR